MRARTILGLALSATLIATLLGPTASASVTLERVVVVLADGVTRPGAAAADLASRAGGTVSQVWTVALKGFAAEVPAAAVEGLRRDPRVSVVEADRIFTAFGEIPSGIDRIEDDKKLSLETTAKNYSSAANPTNQVGVAVIDTGIDNTHPDLNVVAGVDCARNAGCVNGFPGDGNGHGTHVAGTIGAKDDGVGVVGVIPGVDLYAVRVLDNRGSGYLSWIIAGLNWVAARAGTIDVGNMSLGASGSDSSLESAVRNTIAAGVTIAVAAGNSAANAGNYTPARVTEAITVSAIADGDGKAGGAGSITCRSGEADDRFASFSNYGSVVDVAAPGVCITSTWRNGGYDTISGTSMATPHVAGAAALYKFENPSASPSAIQSALKGSWSTSQSGSCGYSSYSGRTAGPLLMLASCDIATGGGGGTASAPTTFTKLSPTSGSTASSRGGGVTLSWEVKGDATYYIACIRVGSSGSPSCSSQIAGTSGSIKASSLTKGTTYQWQVTAYNGGGSTGANGTTWWSFIAG